MDVAGWPSRRDGHRWAGTVAAVLGYRAGIECIAHLPDGVRRRNRHPDRSSTVFAPTGALPRARTSVVWLLGLSTHTFNQVIRRRGPETQRDPELVERRHFPESFFIRFAMFENFASLGIAAITRARASYVAFGQRNGRSGSSARYSHSASRPGRPSIR